MINLKKIIFLSLFLVSSVWAQPRNPLPDTPSKVWQNDLDLRDMIESRVKSVNGSTAIGNLADGTTTYLQLDSEDGAPPATDCDNNSERGRTFFDYSGGTGAYLLHVCTGADDGWDTLTLTD